MHCFVGELLMWDATRVYYSVLQSMPRNSTRRALYSGGMMGGSLILWALDHFLKMDSFGFARSAFFAYLADNDLANRLWQFE